MSQFLIQVTKDGVPVCANIDCNAVLTGFDLRKKKRFCSVCRMTKRRLRWKCLTCDNIITEVDGRDTKVKCNDCMRNGRRRQFLDEPEEII